MGICDTTLSVELLSNIIYEKRYLFKTYFLQKTRMRKKATKLITWKLKLNLFVFICVAVKEHVFSMKILVYLIMFKRNFVPLQHQFGSYIPVNLVDQVKIVNVNKLYKQLFIDIT